MIKHPIIFTLELIQIALQSNYKKKLDFRCTNDFIEYNLNMMFECLICVSVPIIFFKTFFYKKMIYTIWATYLWNYKRTKEQKLFLVHNVVLTIMALFLFPA